MVVVLSLLVPPLLAIYVLVVLVVLDTDRAYAQYALVLPIAYVLGSVPWGFLITQIIKGIDIRNYGSGNIGTSNVLRTAGGRYAVMALALDLSKGLLAVFLAKVVADSITLEVVTGLVVLAGHNWSMFLGFKGGRGIATGIGGLLVMSPLAAGIGFASFVPITLLSRYLSLGSIIGITITFLALLVLVLLGQTSATYLFYAGFGNMMIIWKHRGNIQRLINGTERRFGKPAEEIVDTPELRTEQG